MAHEWDKHGTCAKQSELLDSQHKYFAAGLAIYDQYPFWDWLNEADIVPSATKSYEFANIVRVIQARFPKLITVGCRSYKVDNKHHNLLDKIEFCFSKDLQPVDCKHQRDHCEGPVYYPVPNQDFKLTDNMNQTTISTPASSSSAPSASLSSSKINQN